MAANIQKQNTKIALAIIGIAIIVALGVFIFSVLKPEKPEQPSLKPGEEIEQPPAPPPPPKELSPEAKAIRDTALAFLEPVYVSEDFAPAEGKGYMQMVSNLNARFEITYEANQDKFMILVIAPKDENDFREVQQVAEEYFLREILKTQNKAVACELYVVVASIDEELPLYIPPTSLSFCKKES